jgi:acetyl-CoA acetyltransferase
MAEIAARNRRQARDNPNAQLAGEFEVEKLLAEPHLCSPLHVHDCPPISDGAAAIVIAADDAVGRGEAAPVWIRGIDHRYDPHQPGFRDLTTCPSARIAGEKAGVHAAAIDFAELHAPFSHQELILSRALNLGDDVVINPSGGALGANVIMAAGLDRIGEAATRIIEGEANRAVGHATSGACLQQNLVAVLEGE